MSGDSHSEDVSIPSVFLFRKEGDVLRQYAKESIEKNNIRLRVRLAGKAKKKGDFNFTDIPFTLNSTHTYFSVFPLGTIMIYI